MDASPADHGKRLLSDEGPLSENCSPWLLSTLDVVLTGMFRRLERTDRVELDSAVSEHDPDSVSRGRGNSKKRNDNPTSIVEKNKEQLRIVTKYTTILATWA